MIDICWLEQDESDVPPVDDWLSSAEILCLNKLRFPKRRSDWRLGRWTAKRALATCLKLAKDRQTLTQIEIRAAPSGAPEVFLNDESLQSTISLSHSSGRAICAAAAGEVALGCDLERIESRSDAFVSDYFTAEEQALIRRSKPADRAALITLIWSAKESALKALNAGLRLDTRSVMVSPVEIDFADQSWHALQVRSDDQVFHGWWRENENFIETVVADPAPSVPTLKLQTLEETSSPQRGG